MTTKQGFSVDIYGEMAAAADAAQTAGATLAALGIPDWQRLADEQIIGLAWGALGRSGLFEPAGRGDGRPFIVAPAIDEGELIDVAAIDLAHPKRWGRQTGEAQFVGGDAIERCIWSIGWGDEPDPLRLHQNPMSWLRAGAIGTAPLARLDWSALARLRDVPKIIVGSEKSARRLHAALARPVRMPAITVEASE